MLRGLEIKLSPQQYGAALMQAYLGKSSLKWIADFQENLTLNDYSLEAYHSISGEMALLEKSFRIVARMPLYQRFIKVGQRLISRHRNNLALDGYDLRLFRRLLLFFMTLEHHWPGPAGQTLQAEFVPLAKDVVWPLLGQDDWIGPTLAEIQERIPRSMIRSMLGSRLRETLDSGIS